MTEFAIGDLVRKYGRGAGRVTVHRIVGETVIRSTGLPAWVMESTTARYPQPTRCAKTVMPSVYEKVTDA